MESSIHRNNRSLKLRFPRVRLRASYRDWYQITVVIFLNDRYQICTPSMVPISEQRNKKYRVEEINITFAWYCEANAPTSNIHTHRTYTETHESCQSRANTMLSHSFRARFPIKIPLRNNIVFFFPTSNRNRPPVRMCHAGI